MNSIKFFFLLGSFALVNSIQAMQNPYETVLRLESLKHLIERHPYKSDWIQEYKELILKVISPVMEGKKSHPQGIIDRMLPLCNFYDRLVQTPNIQAQLAQEKAQREQEEELRRQQEQAREQAQKGKPHSVESPIHKTVWKNHPQTITLLLERGAPEDPEHNLNAGLHIAAKWDKLETAELLLEAGANIEAKTDINAITDNW